MEHLLSISAMVLIIHSIYHLAEQELTHKHSQSSVMTSLYPMETLSIYDDCDFGRCCEMHEQMLL